MTRMIMLAALLALAAEFVLRLHRLITGAKTRRIEATSLS
jgi:hypothetical protein